MSLMNGAGRNWPLVKAGSKLAVFVLMFTEKSTPMRSKNDSASDTIRTSMAIARSCRRRSASSKSATS